jgi:hypothetical protein
MSQFLEEVADTADQVVTEQRQVARQARAMQRERDMGASWAEVLDQQDDRRPRLLTWMRSSGRKLALATARLSRGLAQSLSAEGHSQRAIARRLGVSHQRISMVLGRRSPPDEPRR